ncbi:MAG: ATP synthase F1 subunit epsilon [Deltaproteobacteria bacterium]|jgi:F-type H+-transporting ATPase subunit epsilon|nr:ATP synthase F1 subunit epsilon [Deltaproteobacteria bacterium]
MSEKQFNLTLVSPDKVLAMDLPVAAVACKGSEGDFAAWPGHIPFLTELKPAVMMYRAQGKDNLVFVGGGFIEVLPNKVTVLANSCELLEEIDLERAEQARRKALAMIEEARAKAASAGQPAMGDKDILQAEIKLMRATARIKAASSKKSYISRSQGH